MFIGDNYQTIYYPFAEMKNFFNFLSEYGQEKVEKKLEKIEERKKIALVNCQVDNLPAEVTQNGYLLISQIFSRVTRTPAGSQLSLFAGYSYSHAVALNIDSDGNLISDGCLKLDETDIPLTFTQNVFCVPGQNGSTEIYYSDGVDAKVAIANAEGIIVPAHEEDKFFNDYQDRERFLYWSKNMFLKIEYKPSEKRTDGNTVLIKVMAN